LSLSGLALSASLLGITLMPVPYAFTQPGPTVDVLGEVDGIPLIQVLDETPTYEPTGQLLLTTVQAFGGPGNPMFVGQVIAGWFDNETAVEPVEWLFDVEQTAEERDQIAQAQMISSQEYATVAALEELGYSVPTKLTVGHVLADSGAYGVIEEGDVFLELNGTALISYTQLTGLLSEIEPGATVQLRILRGDSEQVVEVTTTDSGQGRALIGVLVDPEFTSPVDIEIQINNIGGPSAGLMFALGIIDLLTPEDEAAGQNIAGTGTIGLDGVVGPIGGITQKLAGAARDGAEWFLAPAENCAEVVGNVPTGLRVVRVETLSEALAAVTAIGAGQGETLPTCS